MRAIPAVLVVAAPVPTKARVVPVLAKTLLAVVLEMVVPVVVKMVVVIHMGMAMMPGLLPWVMAMIVPSRWRTGALSRPSQSRKHHQQRWNYTK